MTDPTLRLRRWLCVVKNELPPLFLVGGAVRDRLLGRPYRDLDLICPDPEAFAARLGRLHRAKVVPFVRKADTPCHRVVNRADPDDYLDLSPIQGASVTADLSRRDFTVNAMALPLGGEGEFGPLIDPLAGQRDLDGGIIRACGPDVFRSDPVRILRAFRIAAQLAFTVEADTLALARRDAGAIATAAAERIVKELFELLAMPASAVHVRALDALGALEPIVPEIAPLKGCTQNTYHHLNVWDHSLAALDHLERLLADAGGSLGAATGPVMALLADDRRLALLKLACLLHDLGKPERRRVVPATGRIIFHGHDKAGAALADALALRLKLSRRDRERLVLLVGRHMQALAWSNPGVRPGTLLKWSRRLGDDVVLLILLSLADCLAKNGPASDESARRSHLAWGWDTLVDYFQRILPALSARPLITGRDLLKMGMAPGPRVGGLLATVRAAGDAGEISNRQEALAMARGLVANFTESSSPRR